MDYVEWTKAIGERFFNQEHAGQVVFLSVEEQTLVEIAKTRFDKELTPELAKDEFALAVRRGIQSSARWACALRAAIRTVSAGLGNVGTSNIGLVSCRRR